MTRLRAWLDVMPEHPSTPRSRLLCLLGLHDWVQGKYVRYCRRCWHT